MEYEINRWKNLATLSEHHFENEKVIMVRAKTRAGRGPTKLNKDILKSPDVPLRKSTRHRKEEFVAQLDLISKQQKKSIGRYLTGGNLNTAVANSHLETEAQQPAAVEFNISERRHSEAIKQVRDRFLRKDKEERKRPTRNEMDVLMRKNKVTNILKSKSKLVEAVQVQNRVVESFRLSEPRFMPPMATQNKETKYKTLNALNRKMISTPLSKKAQDNEKLDLLTELQDTLACELEQLDENSKDYSFRRVHVYSRVFDKIINEFKTYQPVLSQIKVIEYIDQQKEYDRIINAVETEETEVENLRSQVQNLLNQNENRLMLDFERKRREALSNKLKEVQEQNSTMKKEFRRKLGMFATYLPTSILKYEQSQDPEFVLEEDNADPISVLEKKIDALERQLSAKSEAFDNLQRLQEQDYVPKAVKDQLDFAIRDAEYKIDSLTETQNTLNQMLADKMDQLTKLEVAFTEKETEFLNLQQEYNSVSDTLSALLLKSEGG